MLDFSKRSSRTLLVASLIFVSIFIVLEYAGISLIFGNATHNMNWYIGKNENIQKYNESLFLARNGQYLEAKSLLALVLNQTDLENSSDVFELYGDLVYKTGGGTGDILPFYQRALTYGENLRVEQKIMLIEVPPQAESPRTENTGSTATGSSMETVSTSGSMGHEAKKQELETLQRNRRGMINFSPETPGDIQKDVQGILNILGGGEEKREW